MGQKQQIILGYHQGKSQRKLAEELGISRSTVFTCLKAYKKDAAFSDGGFPSSGVIEAPCYDSSNRSRRRLSDEMCDLIDGYLKKNAEKVILGRRKQQLKNVDIHTALLEAGHQISYSTVNSYIRTKRLRVREAYIRQHGVAGASAEFDWGEVCLSIGGEDQRFQLAVFSCTYSNHRWAHLFDRQDMSSFLQAHSLYFSFTGGIAGELIYDNMRVAVSKFAVKNADKEATDDLLKLSAYYGFSLRFCNAYRGNEKGHVERSVEYIRRKAFCIKDEFSDRQAANEHLHKALQALNAKPASGQSKSIQSCYEEALEKMRSAPPVAFDVGVLKTLKVDKYACVKVDTNYYSVADHLVGNRLNVKIYPDKILVYNSDHQTIAEHQRQRSRFKFYLKIEHYLTTLSRKPGALKGSLSLHQADVRLRHIFTRYFVDRPKDFIELLNFLQLKKSSIKAFDKAVDKCLRLCPHQLPCPDKIRFFLTHTEQNNKPKNPEQGYDKTIELQCQEQLQTIQQLFNIAGI